MSDKHDLQISRDEHDETLLAKKVTLVGVTTINIGSLNNVSLKGNVTLAEVVYSYYNQSSLISGYVYHGFGAPGSNPTTASFKILRETLDTGELLFGGSAATFVHSWSAASLASLSYL